MNQHQLKQARQSLGLTQAAMAAKMGIILRKWERWEGGHSPISAEGATLLRLLVELNKQERG
jgi:DNA-binding transcriptional regulator YiaG